MDNLTRLLAEYSAQLRYADIPAPIVRAATQLMVDSLACAVAAYDCEAAQIGRRLSRGAVPSHHKGRVLGFGEYTTAESAAFINTAMIRNLDFNDTYPGGGHPSDCLGPLLAIAESTNSDGQRLICSMVAAYEVFIRLNDAVQFQVKGRGWDQGYVVGICSAIGACSLLGLDARKTAEAIAITAVANVPMRNTRAGQLSLWKGAATAFAARNGVYAALLAAEGMTGPDRPFEGKHALWDLITGPFELAPFAGQGGVFRTPDVAIKYWPVEYNAQLVVWAALELRAKIDWRSLTEVDVGTYAFAYREIGSEPEKWDPKTRETADHSLPYIFARTLVDGTIGLSAFTEEYFADPGLRPLMKKIRVRIDDEVNSSYPGTLWLKVAATSADGKQHSLSLEDPLGHRKNPLKPEDLASKFTAVTNPVVGPARAASALATWNELSSLSAQDVRAALVLLDVAARD